MTRISGLEEFCDLLGVHLEPWQRSLLRRHDHYRRHWGRRA